MDSEKAIKELTNLPTTIYDGFYQLRITHDLRDKVIALLKEQEAKKVLQIRNVAYRTIGYCPSCGRGLDSYEDGNSGDHITNYCYNCGQAVKWNETVQDVETKTL